MLADDLIALFVSLIGLLVDMCSLDLLLSHCEDV